MTARAVLVAILLGAPGAVFACSCVGVSAYSDEAYLKDLFARADAIVHARVVSLVSKHEARISVLESFKGHPTALKALEGDSAMCGTEFRVGEEAIYIAAAGRISLCSRLPVTSEILGLFRAYKR